jgi:hypothetical protein
LVRANLCVHQSEERLHLPGHVCEGRQDSGLKVVHRFCAGASLKFVLTSRNQESLFGPEATLLCGGANFCPEFLTWERQIALDAVFSHVISPPFLVWRTSTDGAFRPPELLAVKATEAIPVSRTICDAGHSFAHKTGLK